MKSSQGHRAILGRRNRKSIARVISNLFVLLAIAGMLVSPSASATTYYWDTTSTGLWSAGTNWSLDSSGSPAGSVAPISDTTSDSVVFNGSGVTGAETVQLDASTSIAGITFDNTGTTLIDASVAGSQSLSIGAGGITINSSAGAVTIGNATNLTPITLGAAQAWNNNALTLFTVVNSVNNNGNLLTVGGTGNTTISGALSGGGGVTMTGSGTLALGNALNSYTGLTTISAGTLSVGNVVVVSSASGLGNATSAVVLGDASNKGTLSYTGNTATYTRGFTINGGGGEVDVTTSGQTLSIASATSLASGALTFGGAGNVSVATGAVVPFTGSGSLTKTGAGTLTVTTTGVTAVTASASAMPINVNQGIMALVFANNAIVNPLGTGLITITPGATLTFAQAGQNGNTYANAITIANASGNAIVKSTSGAVPFAGAVTFAAGANTPTFRIDNTNGTAGLMTFSGGFTGTGNIVFNGTGTNGATITLSGGTVNNVGTLSNIGTGGTSTATVSAPVGANVGNITQQGTTPFTVSGAITLGGDRTYSSSNTGLFTIGAMTGTATTGNTQTVTFSSSSGQITANGNIADGGAGGKVAVVTNSGTGALAFAGAATYTGGATLNAGSINVPTSNTVGPIGSLTSGPFGTSTVTLAGGGLRATINNSVTLGNAFAANADTTFLAASATGTDKDLIITGPITMSADRIFTVNTLPAAGSTGIFFNGTVGGILGTEALTKSGVGTLVFGGTTSYTGLTTVNAGTLEYLNTTAMRGYPGSTAGTVSFLGGSTLGLGYGVAAGQFGAADVANVLGGTLLPGAFAATGTSLGLDTSVAGATYSNVIGNISGTTSSGFTKLGTNTLTVGTANTYTGPTVIQNGAVNVGVLGSVGAAASSLGAPADAAAGTISLGFGGLTGQLLYTGAGETTDRVINLSGNAGGGNIDQSGAGVLNFTSPLTFTGGAAVAKTLTLQGSTVGTGEISGAIVASALTINKSGTNTWLLSGTGNAVQQLALNGGILDIGAGGITVANAGGNTIQAPTSTTINATGGGILTIAQNSTTDGGNVGAASGQTLTINAKIGGANAFENFVVANGTGVTVLTAANTYTGNTLINSSVLSVSNIGNPGSTTSNLGTGTTIAINNAGSTLRYTGTGEISTRIISLPGTTGGGILDQSGPSGLLKFTTNFATPGGGAKTLTLTGSTAGTGEISGIIRDNTVNAFLTNVTKTGTGTWTLSGVNTYTGATTINAGTLNINGSIIGGIVNVNAAGTLGGTGTIGNGTSTFAATAGSVVVAGGTTAAAQGTISLVDGVINTLTIKGNSFATPAAQSLTLGGTTAGTTSNLNFDIGTSTTDTLVLSGGNSNKVLVQVGGATINLTPLADSVLAEGTYNLMTFAAGTFTGGFTLGSLTDNGGLSYTLNTTSTNEQLIVTPGATGDVYWKGTTNTWNVLSGSTSLNFTTTRAGGTLAGLPTSTSNVYMAGDTAGNFTTTLGQNFTLNSLSFTGTGTPAASNAMTIGGTSAVVLKAANGFTDTQTVPVTYPAGVGLVVQPGSAANFITANVTLGASQSWEIDNAAANALTVSGVIGGNLSRLTKTGTGTLIVGGANVYNGGTTIANGTLIANVSSATTVSGAAGPSASAITLGSSAPGSGSASLLANSFIVSNPINLAAGAVGTLTIGNNGAATAAVFNGAIAMNGMDLTVRATGTGSTTLGGAITGSNPIIFNCDPTASITLSGASPAFSSAINLPTGTTLIANPTTATNSMTTLGTGQITLSGGTLSLKNNGASTGGALITTGDGTTGNNVVVSATSTINVDRGTANTGNGIALNTLDINGSTLNVTGANAYNLVIAGTTTMSGAATFNATTAPLNLLGKVSNGGNNFTVSGTGATRLLNVATGAGANAITGTINVSGGVLLGFAPAADAITPGSNSLGANTTINLSGTNPVLRLAPTLAGGLATATTPGLFEKGYINGATLTSLGATNFLGASQAVTAITTNGPWLNTPAGGQFITNALDTGAPLVGNVFSLQTSFQLNGLLKITTPGMYLFTLTHDDGMQMYIDGNGGVGTPGGTGTNVTSAFYLTAGLHTFSDRLNNNGGNGRLTILYQGPDTGNTSIAMNSGSGAAANVFSVATGAALATSFSGNNITLAAGTAATIETASNTTLGGLTMTGTGAGTSLTINGTADLTTLSFSGATTLTDNLALTNATANVTLAGNIGVSGGSGFALTKSGFGSLTVRGIVGTGAAVGVSGGSLSFNNDGAGNNGTIAHGGSVNIGASGTTVNVGNGGASTGNTVAFNTLTMPGTTATTTTFTGTDGYNISFATLVMNNSTGQTTTLSPTTTNLTIGNVINPMSGFSTGNFDTVLMDGTSTGNAITGNISDAVGGSFAPLVGGFTRVIKQNTSTWTLSGTGSTYTGITQVLNGTLKSGNNNVIPLSNLQGVDVTATGAGVTAVYDFAGFNQTLNGARSINLGGSTSTSAPIVTGVGSTITLGGNVTFTGANSPLGGIISVSTLDLGGAERIFTVDDSSSATDDLTVTALIQNGSLNKAGTGQMNLTAANTYAGGTTITAGILLPSGSGRIGASSGALTINGGTLDLNGTTQTVGNFGGSGGTVVNNGSGTDVVFTIGSGNGTGGAFLGTIADGSGTIAVTKIGTGTIALNGPNTFSKAVTVNGGLLAFSASEHLGNGASTNVINLAGGGISYTGAGPLDINASRVVNISSPGGTLDVAADTGALTISGGIATTAAANLTKTGPGKVILPAANPINLNGGTTTIAEGTLRAGFGTGGTSALSVAGIGNMEFVNGVAETLTLGSTAGALTLAGGAKLGFELGATGVNDRVAVGVGGTAVTGGTITLNFFDLGIGVGTYSLITAPSGLSAANYVVGTAPAGFNYNIIKSGSLVQLTTTALIARYWNGAQAGGSWTGTNWSSDATGLIPSAVPSGAHTVIFSASNAPFTSGSSIDTTLDAAFAVDSMQFISVPAGVTTVTVAPGTGGTLSLNPVSPSNGILVGNNAGAIGISAPITVAGPQTWTVDGTGTSSLAVSGNVAFTAAMTKSGGGALTLSGNNSGAGGVTLSGGTLNLGSAAPLGAGTLTVNAGSTLDNTTAGLLTLANAQVWNGSFTYAGTAQSLDLGAAAVTLGNDVTVNVAANQVTVGGVISGSGMGLTKAGLGQLILSGTAANTFDGPVIINGAGSENTSNALILGKTAGVNAIAGTSVTIGNNSGAVAAALRLAADDQINDAAIIHFNGGIGAESRFELNGHNETIAGLVVDSGDLATVQNLETGGAGTSTLTIKSNTFDTNYAGFVRDQSGIVAITKDGLARVSFSGPNITYTGPTTIKAGTFELNGASAFASPVTFDAGSNAVFQIAGATQSVGGLATVDAVNANNIVQNAPGIVATLTVNQAADTTFGGLLRSNPAGGQLGLAKRGLGKLTINSVATYTGGTLIDEGTLAFAQDESLAGNLTMGLAAGSTNVSTVNFAGNAAIAGTLLVRTNSAAVNTITIGANKSLSFGAGLTMGIDSGAATATKLTVSGGGSMSVIGNVQVGVSQGTTNAGNNSVGTLDLSGLTGAAGFTSVGTNFNVGQGNTSGGFVTLTNTANSITATLLTVGDSNGSNGIGTNALTLGTGSNVIRADTINIGLSKIPGTISFLSQTAGSPGTVSIANKAGTGGSAITVGFSNTGTAAVYTGVLDLRGHAATVNATTLTIGSTAIASSGTVSGVVSFDTGTFDATTLNLGSRSAANTGTAGTHYLNTATLNVGGGTFTVSGTTTIANNSATGAATVFADTTSTINLTGGNLNLGSVVGAVKSGATNTGVSTGNINVSGGALVVSGATFSLATQSNAGTSVGFLNITGGSVTSSASITDGGGAATTSINLDGGTLNMTNNSIGSAATPIDTLTFASGTLKNVAQINGGAALNKTTAGTLTAAGVNAYTGATNVTAGRLISTGSIAGSSAVTVSPTATFEAAATQTVKSLIVQDGGTAEISGAALKVLTTNALSITGPTGNLNLHTNAMVVNYTGTSPLLDPSPTGIRAAIVSAYNGGDWLGKGIGSTEIAASIGSSKRLAVGFVEASDLLGAGGGTWNLGQSVTTPVDGTAILVRTTLAGDADMSGDVGLNDLLRLANHYGLATAPATSWYDGDFDYSGDVGLNDLLQLANNYGQAMPSSAIPSSSPQFAADMQLAFELAGQGVTSVPEPTGLGLAALAAAAALLRRNRGRQRNAA